MKESNFVQENNNPKGALHMSDQVTIWLSHQVFPATCYSLLLNDKTNDIPSYVIGANIIVSLASSSITSQMQVGRTSADVRLQGLSLTPRPDQRKM